MVSFTPRPLYPRLKRPSGTHSILVCGPMGLSRRGSDEKIIAPAGNRTPVIQPVALSLNGLFRLLICSWILKINH